MEVSEHRAELVRDATRDLPVTVHTADGRDPGLEPGFDRILVDAPCSGLGALRRRPEARWRKAAGDIPALVALQRELLDSALRLVRPGGVVLYATCSPHLSETVSVMREAGRRDDVELIDVRDVLTRVCGERSTARAADRGCSCGRIGTARTRCSWRPCVAPPECRSGRAA